MQVILFLLSFISAPVDHDIHISNCDIMDNRSEQKVEISLKIFYDDLLRAVGLQQGEELPAEYKGSDDLIEKFLKEHLEIIINGEIKDFKYEESYSYPPAVWTTLVIDQNEIIENMVVKNTILLDVFSDQKNIITIEIGNRKKKFFSLDHDEKKAIWE